MTSSRHLYINLDQASGRRTHMEKTFAALQLSPTRIPGVNGRALNETEFRQLNPPSPTYQPLTPGEIGCFLSHRKAWQIIADGDEDMVAVFEDDIHLSRDASKWLLDFNWIPKGVDFVKLDAHHHPVLLSKTGLMPNSNRALSGIHSEVLNTAGYVISRRCAAKLLERLSVMEKPLDVQLFAPELRTFRGMRLTQMWPAICIQNDSAGALTMHDAALEPSSICDTHHLRALPIRPRLAFGISKIRRELHRPFRQVTAWTNRTAKTIVTRGHWRTVPFLPD